MKKIYTSIAFIVLGFIIVSFIYFSSIGKISKSIKLKDELKHDSAVLILRWIVKNKRMPGCQEDCENYNLIKKSNRFIVICDYMDIGSTLSDDSRVVLVNSSTMQKCIDTKGFRGVTYIKLNKLEESKNKLHVSCMYIFGEMQGFIYEFKFYIEKGKIHCKMESVKII